jgi:hypothetical protein
MALSLPKTPKALKSLAIYLLPRRRVAGMLAFLSALFCWFAGRFGSRIELEFEVIALRHQLGVLAASGPAVRDSSPMLSRHLKASSFK